MSQERAMEIIAGDTIKNEDKKEPEEKVEHPLENSKNITDNFESLPNDIRFNKEKVQKELDIPENSEQVKSNIENEKSVDKKIESDLKSEKDIKYESEDSKKEVVPEVTTEIETVHNDETEIILSNQSLKSSNPSISITTSQKNVKDRHLMRHQSDILPSLKEIPREEDPSMMIFSHKGLPTKKYFRRREVDSTILPFGFNDKNDSPTKDSPSPRIKNKVELTPKISEVVPNALNVPERKEKTVPFDGGNPNESNPSISRNVLTGRGISSQDEFKYRSTRRKDGNPVLGLGYEEPIAANNTGRVPPGGFSSGLW